VGKSAPRQNPGYAYVRSVTLIDVVLVPRRAETEQCWAWRYFCCISSSHYRVAKGAPYCI